MDETLRELAVDHRTDMMATANDGFDISLEIVGDDVVINGVPKKVIFKKKENANGDTKHIGAKIGDIDIGDVVEFQSRNWLIISFPANNDVYLKADVRLCNSTYPIISGNKTRELLGYDQFDKPQYHYVYEVNKQEPCIVEMGTYTTDTNAQLVIPKNNIHITIKYQPSETLKENYVFTMYNTNYKITDIDYTKVINDKGIIKITAERE